MTEKQAQPAFNTNYAIYDNVVFLRRCAERLVTVTQVKLGQRVLYVACG